MIRRNFLRTLLAGLPGLPVVGKFMPVLCVKAGEAATSDLAVQWFGPYQQEFVESYEHGVVAFENALWSAPGDPHA